MTYEERLRKIEKSAAGALAMLANWNISYPHSAEKMKRFARARYNHIEFIRAEFSRIAERERTAA